MVLLSLGVADSQESQALDAGVRQLIDDGLVVVIAAGNTQSDACTIVPASVGGTHGPAITVAGSNMLPHQNFSTADNTTERLYKCAHVCCNIGRLYSTCGRVC